MQTVAGIDEAAIAGNHDLGAEVTTGEAGRQAGDSLPRSQPPLRGIVVEQDDVRAFLLEGVAPAAIGVDEEMPRPITWRERNSGGIVRGQNSRALIKLPDENPIQS